MHLQAVARYVGVTGLPIHVYLKCRWQGFYIHIGMPILEKSPTLMRLIWVYLRVMFTIPVLYIDSFQYRRGWWLIYREYANDPEVNISLQLAISVWYGSTGRMVSSGHPRGWQTVPMRFRGHGFETALHIPKQFSHNWHLPCCNAPKHVVHLSHTKCYITECFIGNRLIWIK